MLPHLVDESLEAYALSRTFRATIEEGYGGRLPETLRC